MQRLVCALAKGLVQLPVVPPVAVRPKPYFVIAAQHAALPKTPKHGCGGGAWLTFSCRGCVVVIMDARLFTPST